MSAARSGLLPVSRVDQALRRILTLKVRRGVFEPLPPRAERLAALGAQKALAGQIARAGVTLLRSGAAFPLKKSSKVGVLTPEASLADALAARRPIDRVVVPSWPAAVQKESLKQQARALAERTDVVVLAIENSRQLELLPMLALVGKPYIVVVLGAPYLASQAREAGTVLEVYSYRASATEAAAAALLGEQGTPGRLPVNLPGAPFGFRLDPVGDRQAKKALLDSARGERDPLTSGTSSAPRTLR